MVLVLGSSHNLMDIAGLVNEIKKKMEVLKQEVDSKQDQLAALLKHSTRVLSEFDKGTEEMIMELHRARDKQV